MTAANDLRVGNWLQYDGDGAFFQITEIGSTGLGVKNKDEETWIELDQFSPIQLQPEILEKASFEGCKERRQFKRLGETSLTGYYEHGEFSIQDFDWYDEKLKNVKHLHQLQNLYHALTGEELNISF